MRACEPAKKRNESYLLPQYTYSSNNVHNNGLRDIYVLCDIRYATMRPLGTYYIAAVELLQHVSTVGFTILEAAAKLLIFASTY